MIATLPADAKTLGSFCSRLPGLRPGTKTHIATLIRYATTGTKNMAGQRVILKAVRFGSRWLTTDAWWDEFVGQMTFAGAVADGEAGPRSPAQRNRHADEAARELIARGA